MPPPSRAHPTGPQRHLTGTTGTRAGPWGWGQSPGSGAAPRNSPKLRVLASPAGTRVENTPEMGGAQSRCHQVRDRSCPRIPDPQNLAGNSSTPKGAPGLGVALATQGELSLARQALGGGHRWPREAPGWRWHRGGGAWPRHRGLGPSMEPPPAGGGTHPLKGQERRKRKKQGESKDPPSRFQFFSLRKS